LAKGVKPGINRNEVYAIEVRIPPLPEQQRLVTILDEVFAALATAKENAAKNLQNARELFESVLQGVFANRGVGWEERKLGEVCEVNPRRPVISRSDLIPTTFVPMSAVDNIHAVIAHPEQRPYSDVKRGYTFFTENDVIFAKITPCMENGKHAIARNLLDGIGFGSTEFHVIRPNEKIIAEWIWYFVRQPVVIQNAAKNFTGTVGQQRVPDSFLKFLQITIPTLPEQRAIVAKLDALSAETKKLEAIYQQKLANLEELKQSVLRKAFRGEI
jgi:type I restriction enzyme S subunit